MWILFAQGHGFSLVFEGSGLDVWEVSDLVFEMLGVGSVRSAALDFFGRDVIGIVQSTTTG